MKNIIIKAEELIRYNIENQCNIADLSGFLVIK